MKEVKIFCGALAMALASAAPVKVGKKEVREHVYHPGDEHLTCVNDNFVPGVGAVADPFGGDDGDGTDAPQRKPASVAARRLPVCLPAGLAERPPLWQRADSHCVFL